MKFSDLLASAGLDVRHLVGEADVGSVTADSRRVEAGSCFVAVRGAVADGHRFIPAAVAAGAAAVVCEDDQGVPEGFPRAVVPDTRRALGPLAQAAVGWPVRNLTAIGITGPTAY